ncbi:uncharacterized protein TEOVI_000211300 [Trypanosoma equiperdum]|uniref:Uncharacterized protein n=3 Tax=Trypanozoon TaxID=39700 RepID=Q586Y3_TRYB2|nr:hypothetical protein, conserved [Trypanosoma brucei brucei TREU927]AAQ15799.1 hypothetical protein, conserved [Trypanosoma brucei brucei TREU927]AAX79608.1 hypothetical protein, conserved [Trypanosoma brucei]RHW74068.1 hypothetical protein DPX39_020012500 [Trypanosoma brucei equiperdum]SCU70539.1 hypothetical protein, conserved [Trypanosoma equiperdum]
MVSRDSRYIHRRWYLEDATLTIQQPKLELLVDFDDPSSFAFPANLPPTLGMRRAAAVATATGGLSGVMGLGSEGNLLADWREIGIPPFTEE